MENLSPSEKEAAKRNNLIQILRRKIAERKLMIRQRRIRRNERIKEGRVLTGKHWGSKSNKYEKLAA